MMLIIQNNSDFSLEFDAICYPCYYLFAIIMRYRYAMVCSSNQNRSMEAHFLLKRQGFDVSSYGTGAHVKLPGPSLREPNVYDFGTPYKQMFDDLRRKDPELYPSSTSSRNQFSFSLHFLLPS
ncbi:hypothetical protein Ahy_A07g034479 isoform B [Arachis hypogaea]|uniref:RNA polymerase II subunit A C-terminal domain phosphatase SSU72 n=1 Tax=Arachis hypogaea TaxID=3818 RepID=A0A445CC74_ARAHY|nr:hypothetical protein Ahy_A07g034479 isoform B [Arachis hypogaea]